MRNRRTVVSLAVCAIAGIGLVAGAGFASTRHLTGVFTERAPDTAKQLPAVPANVTQQPPPRPVEKLATKANRPKSSAELPAGAAVPAHGAGTWHTVPGSSAVVGAGTVYTYSVQVENGVQLPEGDQAWAEAVHATLSDPRSWTGKGTVAFRRVGGSGANLRIRLASQQTARAKCGFEIPVDVSCRQGNAVYLNAARWVRGAVAFDGDLASYRAYMVNHEVGHFIGKKHRPCNVDGGPAPVMMQQTFSTSNDEIAAITAGFPQGVAIPKDGKTCRPNPWPYP